MALASPLRRGDPVGQLRRDAQYRRATICGGVTTEVAGLAPTLRLIVCSRCLARSLHEAECELVEAVRNRGSFVRWVVGG